MQPYTLHNMLIKQVFDDCFYAQLEIVESQRTIKNVRISVAHHWNVNTAWGYMLVRHSVTHDIVILDVHLHQTQWQQHPNNERTEPNLLVASRIL